MTVDGETPALRHRAVTEIPACSASVLSFPYKSVFIFVVTAISVYYVEKMRDTQEFYSASYKHALQKRELQGEIMKTGLYLGIANADYHSGPGISKSGLDLIARSPLHYWAAYIDPERKPREESDAMFVGTAIHAAVLEPDEFDSTYLPAPKIDRRTKEGKAMAADLEAMAIEQKRLLIDEEDYKACLAIRDQVRLHPAAKVLFGDGVAEQSGYWTDDETGILCRVRPDWLRTDICVDVKSTEDASPQEFRRSIVKWRYHVQAAWYLDGLAAIGHPVDAFIFCVFEKKRPYASAFYYADADMIEIGRREYRKNLRIFADCLSSDRWPGYSTEIQSISLPQWVLNAANDNKEP